MFSTDNESHVRDEEKRQQDVAFSSNFKPKSTEMLYESFQS